MQPDDPRAQLAALAHDAGDSLAALSRMLRRNPAYLQQYVRRGTPRILPELERQLLADHFGVAQTLLGGREADPDGAVLVPYLEVSASAGPGRAVEGERVIRHERLAPALLRDAGIRPGGAAIIDAVGDSMAPGIVAGDRLLVDGEDRRVTRKPAIMVLRHNEGLLVKRVARSGHVLTIASDNPAYPTMHVPFAEVDLRGRVKLLIRKPC